MVGKAVAFKKRRSLLWESADQTDLLGDYQRDGFVLMQGFLSDETLGELRERLDRLIAEGLSSMPPEHVFYEDKDDPESLKQLQHVDAYEPWIADLFHDGVFRKLAEALLQGEVVPKNLQYFNKPPCVGKATPPHQDGYYFKLDPCEALTMWLALEPVNEENGCVRYVRGSHRSGMRPHGRTQTLGFSQGITDFPNEIDQRDEVICRAAPGDLLAHDAMTIHYAEGNRSEDRSRRAMGFIYYSARAKEDLAAHRSYQETLVADLKSSGKI